MNKFFTPYTDASIEQVIEKSRFISHIKPVESRVEADDFISAIRRENRGANHNVPVIVLGEKMETQWTSDDGEPRGTAGPPMLNMLVNKKVTNLALVVTRYFGGIKLGTGGLVRAYTSAAQLVLDKAELAEIREIVNIRASFDYTYLKKIENLMRDEGRILKDIKYEDIISGIIVTEPENVSEIKKKMMNITSGKVEFISDFRTVEKVKYIT